MTKLSNAEKQRRKEEEIVKKATHLLNIIWACRDDAKYNGVQWFEKDQYTYMKMYQAFMDGIMICGGRKWYNRLNKLWNEYEELHGYPIKIKEVSK